MKTKFIVLLKRKDGISPAEFRDHYENSHVPLGAKFIGHLLVHFSRHYPGMMADFTSDDWSTGRMGDEDAGCAYDAISIYEFRDEAAIAEMAEILKQPHVSQALSEDEKKFLDRAACRMGLCDVIEGSGMVAKQS
ncbi:EthD domain-containing protein [Sphingobium sp. JS3065]|uniref:EthD domain-containing protein n=1 Tax=Sphingobium sp. JS3065 TaxID=2970925 RepID=UPI002264094C|nr:EthD domain-containing protein [Sphingobium sp. JS3065]UZW57242.1 EthD domain-containing protein [Sphingobium sp. JS3065]